MQANKWKVKYILICACYDQILNGRHGWISYDDDKCNNDFDKITDNDDNDCNYDNHNKSIGDDDSDDDYDDDY